MIIENIHVILYSLYVRPVQVYFNTSAVISYLKIKNRCSVTKTLYEIFDSAARLQIRISCSLPSNRIPSALYMHFSTIRTSDHNRDIQDTNKSSALDVQSTTVEFTKIVLDEKSKKNDFLVLLRMRECNILY